MNPTVPDIQVLSLQFLLCAFALALVFGAIAQRTHFCTMGAVADIVTFGDWTRMRMWVLAIGVAMVGFNAMVWLGWIDAAQSSYGGTRFVWLSALVGGLMFGFGTVVASGCVSETLVRLGGGKLKALVVAIVLGLSAIATLKGVTAVVRVASVDTVFIALPAQQNLPALAAQLFGGAKAPLSLALGLLVGVGGVTPLGCTIGRGISGVSTLGLTSFVALAAILTGAVVARRVPAWRIAHGA